jgi:HSP20 family molecular chaperone IbpA
MTSSHSSLSHPFHIAIPDTSSSNPTFQSLHHYSIENPFFHRLAPETREGNDEHKVENALIRHHVHHLHSNTVTPFFDVHESKTAYFLEGEFPGISDKNAIVLEKAGPRTLAIETKLPKLNLHDKWRGELHAGLFKQFEDINQTPTQTEDTTSQEITDGGVKELEPTPVALEDEAPAGSDKEEREIEAGDTLRTPSWIQMNDAKPQHEEGVRALILERHGGLLGRSFTFPKAVDFSALKAKLRDGLLLIMVPKAEEQEQPKRQRILIVD